MSDLWDDYPEFRWNPSKISYGSIDVEPPERAYWHAKTPQERLRAAEFLRRLAHGYGPPATRVPHMARSADRRAG